MIRRSGTGSDRTFRISIIQAIFSIIFFVGKSSGVSTIKASAILSNKIPIRLF